MSLKPTPDLVANRTRMICGLIVLFEVSAMSFALGQAVYSNPAGYVKLGNTTAAEPAVAANKDVYISIPLESKLEAVGEVASTTATTITFANTPAWSVSPEQWAPNPTPYGAIITSGAENGLRCVISSNTADTLTVSLSSPGDLTNVSAGDSVAIRKCWTLKTFFESMNLPDGTQVLLRDETLTGINQVATDTYFFGGGNWFDGLFADANEVILYPGESFVLRSSAEIPELTAFGDVSTSNLRNVLVKDGTDPSGEDLHIASMSPVPVLASASGIPVGDGDQLLAYSPSGTGINQPATSNYVFGGGNWFDSNDNFAMVTATLTLEPGVGYILRRANSSPTLEEWTQLAPY